MNDLQPQGFMRRVSAALALLVAVGFGAKMIYDWLKPIIPTLVVLVILLVLFNVIVRRFGR